MYSMATMGVLMCDVSLTGTVCDFRLSYGRVLNRRSKIIAVNRDKSQLLKNSDMFWKPTVAIQGEHYKHQSVSETDSILMKHRGTRHPRVYLCSHYPKRKPLNEDSE